MSTPERRSIFIVTSGSYSDYRVHAAFERQEDADAAIAAGLGDDWDTFPLMAAGDVPARKPVYRAYAFVHATDPALDIAPVVEIHKGWDFDPDVDEFDDNVWTPGAHPGSRNIRATSNDRERALKRAADAYAKLRAEREGL